MENSIIIKNKHDKMRLKIRKISEENGLKYIYIAKCIGISNSTLSHFLANDRRFSNATINKIEKYVSEYSQIKDI